MRHWLVISEDGEASFIVTDDFEHPRDFGYADGYIITRMVQPPGEFTRYDGEMIIKHDQALCDAQSQRLPQTAAELDALIADRIAAALLKLTPNMVAKETGLG